jgi:hypothetical protein
VGLDLEPDAVSGFGRPDSGHLRPGVARDHVLLSQSSRRNIAPQAGVITRAEMRPAGV